jgi:hypothetical protein
VCVCVCACACTCWCAYGSVCHSDVHRVNPPPRFALAPFAFYQSVSYDESSSQADASDLSRIFVVLQPLFELRPSLVSAAADANLIPGLVRALRKLRSVTHVDATLVSLAGRAQSVVEPPLFCLNPILQSDLCNTRGLWKHAVNAGIVPDLIYLLAHGDEQTVSRAVLVSGLILTPAAREELGWWAPGLVRAMAQLLNANPPVVPSLVLSALCTFGTVNPDIGKDCRTWGIEASVQRLTMHSDPDTAALAVELKELFFVHQAPEVGPKPLYMWSFLPNSPSRSGGGPRREVALPIVPVKAICNIATTFSPLVYIPCPLPPVTAIP